MSTKEKEPTEHRPVAPSKESSPAVLAEDLPREIVISIEFGLLTPEHGANFRNLGEHEQDEVIGILYAVEDVLTREDKGAADEEELVQLKSMLYEALEPNNPPRKLHLSQIARLLQKDPKKLQLERGIFSPEGEGLKKEEYSLKEASIMVLVSRILGGVIGASWSVDASDPSRCRIALEEASIDLQVDLRPFLAFVEEGLGDESV